MRLTTKTYADRRVAVHPPLSASLAWLVILLALLLISWVDWATESVPIQHLFYLPIMFAAVRFGRRGGLVSAALAIVLYHVAHPELLAWQHDEADMVQIVLFAAVGLVTALLRDDARLLHHLASTDDLTGLHNLRSFEVLLKGAVQDAAARRTPMAILVLDVDRLKSLNDVHGHLTGAEAVRTVGHLIAEHIPSNAFACRYGGDEFVVGLPGCEAEGAAAVAEEIRRAVVETAPVLADQPFPPATLTVSIGISFRTFTAADGVDDNLGERLFNTADRALYEAKRGGRDRVCSVEWRPESRAEPVVGARQ